MPLSHIERPSPASQTAASLPAPAAGQGVGTPFAPLRFGLGTWCVICSSRRRIVCYPFTEGLQERRA